MAAICSSDAAFFIEASYLPSRIMPRALTAEFYPRAFLRRSAHACAAETRAPPQLLATNVVGIAHKPGDVDTALSGVAGARARRFADDAVGDD